MTAITRRIRAVAGRAGGRWRAGGREDGLTLVEVLVAVAVTGIIMPVVVLLIVSLVRANVNVQNTMTGVRQDETAGEALLQYLHGTTVVLPGSTATTLNASILAGFNTSSYTADTATLSASISNSSNPNLDATFQTTLTPDGSSSGSTVSTYDAVDSSSVFTYYYNNGSSGLTSTTAPTNSILSEIVAVQVNVTFLAGPHVPKAGFQSVRSTHFDTTVYLQNASGDPSPGTTTSIAAPSNPAVGSPVTLTATVSPTPDGGNITFSVTYNGSPDSVCTTPVDVDTTAGTATCTFTPMATGTYGASAAFSGTSDFQPSTSTTTSFVIPTSTTTSISCSGTANGSNSTISCTATVSPTPDGGTVTFTERSGFSGSKSSGQIALSGATASYTFTGLSSSTTYTVTAQYSGSPDGLYQGSTSSQWSGKP